MKQDGKEITGKKEGKNADELFENTWTARPSFPTNKKTDVKWIASKQWKKGGSTVSDHLSKEKTRESVEKRHFNIVKWYKHRDKKKRERDWTKRNLSHTRTTEIFIYDLWRGVNSAYCVYYLLHRQQCQQSTAAPEADELILTKYMTNVHVLVVSVVVRCRHYQPKRNTIIKFHCSFQEVIFMVISNFYVCFFCARGENSFFCHSFLYHRPWPLVCPGFLFVYLIPSDRASLQQHFTSFHISGFTHFLAWFSQLKQ